MRHVHGPHRSTQLHPEKTCASPRRVHDAQALLTLYGAPDCRRPYAEGPGDAPLADSAGYHLDDRGLLFLGQPARSAQFLAVRLLQTRLGAAAGWTPALGRTPGRRSQPEYSPRTTPANRGRHPILDLGLLVTGLAANPDSAPLQVVDVAHDVQPAPPDAVDGHHTRVSP